MSRYFGEADFDWSTGSAPSWDRPAADSVVNVQDSAGNPSTAPFYLASDVPPPEVPAHGYNPTQDYASNQNAGTISQGSQVQPETGGRDVLGTVIDIFGRVLKGGQTQYTQPMPPPQQPGVPIWAWIIGGVGVVAVLGVVLSSGRSRSVAGYRRKSKRSKR